MATQIHPPGPRRKPIIAICWRFRRNPIAFLQKRRRASTANIVNLQFGSQRFIYFQQPEYIKDVLVTNNRNFVKSRGLEMAKNSWRRVV